MRKPTQLTYAEYSQNYNFVLNESKGKYYINDLLINFVPIKKVHLDWPLFIVRYLMLNLHTDNCY